MEFFVDLLICLGFLLVALEKYNGKIPLSGFSEYAR